jgi:CRP-like cAMP-binding protein
MSPLLRERFAQTDLCHGLANLEIDALFTLFSLHQFSPGIPLYAEGHAADSLYVVLEGEVEVSHDGEVYANVGPGATLGELSLFRDQPRRSATVTAVTGVTVLRIGRAEFQARIASRDVVALTVVSNLAHQMANRLLAINERVSTGGLKGLAVSRAELKRTAG